MSQKNNFLNGEGDQWFARNYKNIGNKDLKKDPIIKIIKKNKIKLDHTLEIGCSNGYRLNFLQQKNKNFNFYGLDPSKKAIEYGKNKFKNISLDVGTADKLNFENSSLNLIIYGFCLYLCDRDDLFKIIYEADRVLKNNGVIIIYDFYSKYPYSNDYKHLKNTRTYKMDYTKLFLSHPNYKLIIKKKIIYDKTIKSKKDNELCLSIVKKMMIK